MTLLVERPGFSAVQDLGRRGVAHLGVPRGGAFDEWALRDGNRLCGNAPGAAAIEFVLAGPTIVADADTVVAIAGVFDATLDGEPVAPAAPVRLAAGSRLRIGSARGGARGYLCVAGGIATEPMLGSCSASPRAGVGAMLAAGDRLPVGPSVRPPAPGPAPATTPVHRAGPVRVVPGPQPFPSESLHALLEQSYTVTTDADRVGVRLDGTRLAHGADGAEIDPEPAIPGAIQVPGDGLPIVLGPDGPATGGYPKIATVIRADLWIIAQARPGDRLTFETCEPPAARRALAERLRDDA